MNIDINWLNSLQLLLCRLELVGIKNPHIAGGALRDMLCEKPIKDVDVFFKEGNYSNPSSYNPYGFSNWKPFVGSYEGNSTFELVGNVSNECVPVNIQLIRVKNVIDTINSFPLGISQVWLTTEGLVLPTTSIEDIENKHLWFNGDCSLDYKSRMLDKFHDWEVVT